MTPPTSFPTAQNLSTQLVLVAPVSGIVTGVKTNVGAAV